MSRPPPRLGEDGDPLNIAAFILAGFAMMLNIRLSYSSAPYALIRFQLPENLFSVFVRRIASALELWCLPSMLLGNILDLAQKYLTESEETTKLKEAASGLSTQANTLSSNAGSLEGQLGTVAAAEAKATALKDAASKNDSGPNRGLEQLLGDLAGANGAAQIVERANKVKEKFESGGYRQSSVQYTYNAVKNDPTASGKTEFTDVKNAFEALQFAYNKAVSSDYKYKWPTITIPSIITQWLNFLTYLILLVVYVMGGDQGHLTVFYFVIAVSGFVFGINMTLVYAADFNYLVYYIAGENCFPILTSFIHYITTLIFGNRRKWNSDFLIVCIDIVVAIGISFVAAVVWTVAYSKDKYIFPFGDSGDPKPEVISPALMVIVGMGLVYAIYPGIAPGMIVPFYLVDKIEMVLLILTTFPPLIIALLRKTYGFTDPRVPTCQWSKPEYGDPGYHWHAFDLLIVTKISLAAIFIYSLHYRNSSLSRSIINQPKMSTALSIVFYMCHESLLAMGFPGIFGSNGGAKFVMLPAQYIGALFMIFLAFYSEGYIIEYKSHDPSH